MHVQWACAVPHTEESRLLQSLDQACACVSVGLVVVVCVCAFAVVPSKEKRQV